MHSVTPGRSRRLLTALLLAFATVAALAATPGVAQARSGHGSYIVLAPGDHGSRVARLQRYLHVRPAAGYYGRVTRAAVVRWQATHHRNRTGLVGKLLWRNVIGAAHTSRRAPAPSRSGDRVTSLNWAALARCESGGNPRAVNPAGYYGLYQFTPLDLAVGGRQRAPDPRVVARADRPGADPVPSCGLQPVAALRPPPLQLRPEAPARP